LHGAFPLRDIYQVYISCLRRRQFRKRYNPANRGLEQGIALASIYDLKPRFQALLRPGVARLAAAGVTANQVTLAAVVLSIIGGGLIDLPPKFRLPRVT
jgi:hypothetical protein